MADKPGTQEVLSKIVEQLEALTARLDKVESQPALLPIARAPDAFHQVMKDAEIGETQTGRRASNRVYPDHPGLLREGSIVRLKDSSSRAQRIKAHFSRSENVEARERIEREGILGVVLGYLLTGRTGQPKFRVQFADIGKDGVDFDELELVRA